LSAIAHGSDNNPVVHTVNLQAQCCGTDVAVFAKCFLVIEIHFFAEFC
jgi:hypothetical protein